MHCPAHVLHPAPYPRGLVHPVVLLEMKNAAYVSKGTRVQVLPGHLRGLHSAHELRRLSTSLSHSRSSAELWVMAVPRPVPDPAAKPNPEDSTTGTCTLSVSSPGPKVRPQRPPAALNHLESRSSGITGQQLGMP